MSEEKYCYDCEEDMSDDSICAECSDPTCPSCLRSGVCKSCRIKKENLNHKMIEVEKNKFVCECDECKDEKLYRPCTSCNRLSSAANMMGKCAPCTNGKGFNLPDPDGHRIYIDDKERVVRMLVGRFISPENPSQDPQLTEPSE